MEKYEMVYSIQILLIAFSSNDVGFQLKFAWNSKLRLIVSRFTRTQHTFAHLNKMMNLSHVPFGLIPVNHGTNLATTKKDHFYFMKLQTSV